MAQTRKHAQGKILQGFSHLLFFIWVIEVTTEARKSQETGEIFQEFNINQNKSTFEHHSHHSSKLMKLIQTLVDLQEETLTARRKENMMEREIKLDIFPPDESYDKHTAPPLERGKPNKIEATIDILSIPSLDEIKEEIMIEVRVTHIWKDNRLLTSKLPSSIALEPSSIVDLWTPDSYFHHTKELKFVRLMTSAASMMISTDQTIKYSVMVMLTIGCPMTFHNYPMDKQVCHLRMQSFSHDINHNTYHWLRPPHIQEDINLDNHEVDIREYNFTYELDGLVYPGLGVKLELNRHLGFHLTQSYMPSTMFVIVGWISFVIPSDAIPGRMVVCVTTLLTLTSMFDSVRTMTPQVSYMKAIDLWVFVCLAFVFSSLVEYGLILYLTSRSLWQRKIDQFRKMVYCNGMAEGQYDDIIMHKLKSRDKQRSKSEPSETVLIPKGLPETQCSNRNNKAKSDTEEESCDQLRIDVECGWNGVATNGSKVRWKEMFAYQLEFYIKLVYPILFLLFNIVYWIHYS